MKIANLIVTIYSIVFSCLLILYSILCITNNVEPLIELGINFKDIPDYLCYYWMIANGIAIILLSLSFGFKNKVFYIFIIVASALALNANGVVAAIFGIIMINKQNEAIEAINIQIQENTNSEATTSNKTIEKPIIKKEYKEKDFYIGNDNLALFIVQFSLEALVFFLLILGLVTKTIYINGNTWAWFVLLIIPLLVVLAFFALCIMAIIADIFAIISLNIKKRWCFKVTMILCFATLQIFAGVAAKNIAEQNYNI